MDPLEGRERRLAAILAADVVRSSRLIEADETSALAAIHAVLSKALGAMTFFLCERPEVPDLMRAVSDRIGFFCRRVVWHSPALPVRHDAVGVRHPRDGGPQQTWIPCAASPIRSARVTLQR
jgi:class 3 adenylate cyclase